MGSSGSQSDDVMTRKQPTQTSLKQKLEMENLEKEMEESVTMRITGVLVKQTMKPQLQ